MKALLAIITILFNAQAYAYESFGACYSDVYQNNGYNSDHAKEVCSNAKIRSEN